MGGFDPGIELHILAQVKLFCDELCVLQRFVPRREVLRPIPFVQDLLGECEMICVAF